MDGSYTSRMALERKDAIEHKHNAHASHKLTPPYSTPLALPFNGENLWREDSASISVENEPIYTHPHHRHRILSGQTAATNYPPPPAFPHATPSNELTLPAAANNSVALSYPLQPPPPLPTAQLKINYPLPPTAAPLHPVSLSASPMQVNPNSKSTLHIPFGLPSANNVAMYHHNQYQQHSQINRDGLLPSRVNSSPALSQLPLTSNLPSNNNNPSLPHAPPSNSSLAAIPLTRNLTTPPLGPSASASPAHTTPTTNVSIPPRPSSSTSISSAVTSPPARSYPQSFTPYPSPQTPNSASSQSSTASASAAASILRSIQSSPVRTRTLGHQPALSAPLRPHNSQQLEANVSHNVRLPFSNPSSPTGMLQPVLPSQHHGASHHSFTFSNASQLYTSSGSKLQQARKKFLPTCSCACVCRGTHEVAGYPELNCSCLTQALPLYSSSHVSAISGTSTSLTLNISSPLQNSEIIKATKCLESGHIFLLHTLVDPTSSKKSANGNSSSSSPHAAAVSNGGALTHVKKIVVFLFQDALYCCNYSASITKYTHPFLKISLCTEAGAKIDSSRRTQQSHPKSWNVDPNPQLPQSGLVFSLDSYANHHPVRFYPHKQGSALRLNKSCPSRRCATLVFPNPEYDAEHARLKEVHQNDSRQSAHYMSSSSRSVSTRVSPSNQQGHEGHSFQVRLEPFAQAQIQMQQLAQQAELSFPPFTQGASHIFATPVPLSHSLQNSPATASENHSCKKEITSPRSPLSPISPIPTNSQLGHLGMSTAGNHTAPLMPTHTLELEASSSAHMHSFIHALHIYLQANSKGGLLVLSGISNHSETHISHAASRLYASSLSNRRARAREERRKQRLAASRMTQAAASLSAQETRMKARGMFDAETGSIVTKAKSVPQPLSEEDRKAEQRAGMRLLGALYDAGRGVREGKRRGEITRRMKEERELETSLREKGFQEYNGNTVRLPVDLQIKSETLINTRRAAEGLPTTTVALPVAPNEPSLHQRQVSEMSISSMLSDEQASSTPLQMNFILAPNAAGTPSDCSTLLSPDQPIVNSEGRDVNFPRDVQAAKLPLHQQQQSAAHHAANKSPQSLLTLAKTKSFFSAFLSKDTTAKPASQMTSLDNVTPGSISQHPTSYHSAQAQVQPHHQAVLPNVHPQSQQNHPQHPQIQSATLHSRGLSSPDLEFGLGLSASHANHAWVNSSHSTRMMTASSNGGALNSSIGSSDRLKLHTSDPSSQGENAYGPEAGVASAVPAHLHAAHFQPHPSPPARPGLNQIPLTQQCH